MADLSQEEWDHVLAEWLRRLGEALRRDGNALNIDTLKELGKIAAEAADQLETPND